MDVFLTFDYELFFGEKSGSVEKCIIEPTNQLIKIAQKHAVKLTFFVDCGHLYMLQKNKNKFKALEKDFESISGQLKELISLGHECALHIHPHWEDAIFDGEEWIFDVKRYKLSDFPIEEIKNIFIKYKKVLEDLTGVSTSVFRAGGWCIQPFDKIESAFKKTGIKLDSTVFPGGFLNSDTHFYDFGKAPDKELWKFSDDVCKEDKNGIFLELPISSYVYSPLFFWKLFTLGRLFPRYHKAVGDGKSISLKGMKKKYLTQDQLLPVSSDGYFSRKLDKILLDYRKAGKSKLVVIGHPKACTLYSYEKLEAFIMTNKTESNFLILSSVLHQ